MVSRFIQLSRSARQLSMVIGVAGLLCLNPVSALALNNSGSTRAQYFKTASNEFGVPESVLLAIAYNESRWEPHGDAPSIDGGYGMMNLTTKSIQVSENGRGTDQDHLPRAPKRAHYTLDEAVDLLHVSAPRLKTDERQNIRGAAAVLAQYAKQYNGGKLPSAVNQWYSTVVAYGAATDVRTAQIFADQVFETLQTGLSHTTTDGQRLSLSADAGLRPNRNLKQLNLSELPAPQTDTAGNVDCPADLNCRFIPAAYAANNPNDPADYGNYDPADRPNDMQVKYIIIHDTEGSYTSAINAFQDPKYYVSANYVIRSSDGAITEMVRPSDVSWGAGDWYVNMHAINIEHEGYAVKGKAWYTESMYRSSATLVRYLAQRYNIPLDRQHIIGHEEVPTTTPKRLPAKHWDPGAFWDWDHYMDLLHEQDDAAGQPVGGLPTNSRGPKAITIAPDFQTNQPPIADCYTSSTCVTLPKQPTNFIYLHTQPSYSSPLLSDPYLHPDGHAGTTKINDWSDKVLTGAQYIVAGQHGDWTAIYYAGQKGWFYNPGNRMVRSALGAQIIKPKAGLDSIPVYGMAYPEASAYPSTITPQTITPLYHMPAGQSYITSGTTPTDYFYDATVNSSLPDDHKIVIGKDAYYQITYNHLQLFVKASDVTLSRQQLGLPIPPPLSNR